VSAQKKHPALEALENHAAFIARHIGPSDPALRRHPAAGTPQ